MTDSLCRKRKLADSFILCEEAWPGDDDFPNSFEECQTANPAKTEVYL